MNTTPATAHGAPLALRCPKCAGEMVTYERSGIHVDQCRECRGFFLDRGELERLVDAESDGAGWAGPAMKPPAPMPLPLTRTPRDDPRLDQRTDQGDGYGPGWFGDDDGSRGRRRVDGRSDPGLRDERAGRPRKGRSLLDLLEGLGE